MIKFFRKIRQRLLSKNRFREYLIYATGEIILVVIGILLALQINTWNQNRITKNELVHILKEIQKNLNQDFKNLTDQIDGSINYSNNIDTLLKNGNNLPIDSLLRRISNLHGVSVFSPSGFGYQRLSKHAGVDLLPDNLTNQLTNYYSTFSYQEEKNNSSFRWLSIYGFNKYRDFLIEYGFPIEMNHLGVNLEKPQDVTDLKTIINNKEFIGILRNNKANWFIQSLAYNDAKQQITDNLKIINKYLSEVD